MDGGEDLEDYSEYDGNASRLREGIVITCFYCTKREEATRIGWSMVKIFCR